MKDPQMANFSKDRRQIIDNLYRIRTILDACVDEGMLDPQSHYHNEVLDFIDEADLVNDYPELYEVIQRVRPLEQEIDAWLALRGRSSLSLAWPNISHK